MSILTLTGLKLGQFQLQDIIGRGGMAAVYRGYQTSLNREVAIKVLSPDLAADPTYLARFNQEAKTAASLEHKNIIPIYHHGTQDGISFVVMRLLTGGTLSQRLGRPWFPADVSALLTQLASALDYAHRRNIVHRDIKPGNIMFDDQGNSYIVDFGIARLLGATKHLTATGLAMGTPTYMAPEQWKGTTPVPATDQYALGIIAYAMLTGRLPFDGSSAEALMYQHLKVQPPPLRALRPDLPDALTQVVHTALNKEAAARFPSITQFAQSFESACRGNTGDTTNRAVDQSRTYIPTAMPVQPYPPASESRPTPPNYQRWPTAPRPTMPPRRANTGIWVGLSATALVIVGVVVLLLSGVLSGDDSDRKTATPDPNDPRAALISATDEPASDSQIETTVFVAMLQTVDALTRTAPTPDYEQTVQTITDTTLTAIAASQTYAARAWTDTPTPSPSPTPRGQGCEFAPPISLVSVGATAEITSDGNGLNLRSSPGFDASIVHRYTKEHHLDITGSAVCADGYRWWSVRFDDGRSGWVADGSTEDGTTVYWIQSVSVYTAPNTLPLPATSITFTVDRTTIARGQCVTLRWDVEGIREVYYQNQGAVGHDQRQECPAVTTTYTLRVILANGTEDYRYITITVAQ